MQESEKLIMLNKENYEFMNNKHNLNEPTLLRVSKMADMSFFF